MTVQTDVLVIGGGTAGFGAAVAAARMGLPTTLLEATQKIGGVMAFCPGMPWGAAFPNDVCVGGLIQELTEKLQNMSPPAAVKRDCTLANFGPEIIYDHDIAITTMFDIAEQSGVDLRLGATALTPDIKDDMVMGVTFCDRRGVQTIKPKVVIDCSGDGDISAKAGVPYSLGDENGNMMGVSLTFTMIGADCEKVFAQNDPYFTKFAQKGIDEGRLHPDLAQLYLMRGLYQDAVFCNSVVIRGVDGTNPKNISTATQEGRRRCVQLAQFLRSDVPGFENARMTSLGPTVGVRETRKLKGIYTVTGDDLAKGTKFPDGIVACDNPIDDVMRSSSDMTHEAIVDSGSYYTIPFRSLMPEKIKNLMFAGRIISADATAFASVRGMPQCMAMGQACGTAAAQMIEKNIPVQRLDLESLVRSLQAQGLRGIGRETLQ